MKNYTYLLINFFTVIIPFAFSFHPRLNFYKTWKAFFPAAIITGFCFILWDIAFTHLDVWGFNERYLIGIEIANLPVEEILFFLCIPYACVFTFHCLSLFLPDTFSDSLQGKITFTLILFLAVFGIVYFNKIYTSVTFLSLAILLAISAWVFKIKWLTKFYIVYGILLLPFLIVNGILTGTGLNEPIVWYNEAEIIGLRIMTIPVEDVFYGMELILINVLLYEYLKDSYSLNNRRNYGTRTQKRR
ncbi:MAG TPA: lycopene cyclase domain-containing protein [Balneolaceae bacterium]